MAARSFVAAFLKDQGGATAVEYGLILSLIFLVIITAVHAFSTNASAMYNNLSSTISAAT